MPQENEIKAIDIRHSEMGSVTSRFNERWMPEPYSGCWLWMGTIHYKGYGVIYVGFKNNRPKWEQSHRVSWEIHRGTIPAGMCVLHRCDTRSCVNPNHLFIGTKTDNNLDRDNKGRHIALRGENHGMSKLTDAQILSIRSDPRPHKLIAAEHGIFYTSVSKIKRRIAWAHV